MNRVLFTTTTLAALLFGHTAASVAGGQDSEPSCRRDTYGTAGRDRIEIAYNDKGVRVSVLINGKRRQTLGLTSPQDSCASNLELTGRNLLSIENIEANTPQCRGSIAVFTPGRRMQFVDDPACFTNESDLVTVNVSAPPIVLPTTVWFVNRKVQDASTGPVRNDIMWTNSLYSDTGCGVELAPPTFKAGSLTGPLSAASLKAMGFDAGRINIYYVADKLEANGLELSRDLLVMGPSARRDTLAHEFGHALSLEHVGDPYNIMGTNSLVRGEVTIGQCFRANLQKESIPQVDSLRLPPIFLGSCAKSASMAGSGALCLWPNPVCPSCHPDRLTDIMQRLTKAGGLVSTTEAVKAVGPEFQLPAAPQANQALQDLLLVGLPTDLAAYQRQAAYDAYYRIKTYERAHPEWQAFGSETEYVASDLERLKTSMQLKAILDLKQLHGVQAPTLLKGVLESSTNFGTLKPIVEQALSTASKP